MSATPPGWCPPGSSDPRLRAYEAARETAAPARGGARLPTAELAALGPGLWPGLHLVFGAHGAGSTQLGIQTAVEAALAGHAARLRLENTAPREAALRVASVVAREPWGQLAERPQSETERHLDRMSGARFTLEPLGALDPHPFSGEPELVVLDPAPSGAALADLRRAALEAGAALLAVAPSVSTLDPIDDARPLSLPEADVAIADQVLLVVPDPAPRSVGAPHPTRVGVAKSRRGVPGWAALTFDGAVFSGG